MRSAFTSRVVALAAFAVLVTAAAAPAASAPGAPAGDAHPVVYVKDGDKYRPATHEEAEKAAHAAHGGILDKLAFTGIKRWDLGVYTLIVFGLLMLILAKFAWPHIKAGLEKREANILTALEQAKQDAAVARTELEAARKELAKAALDAREILDEARRDADALKVAKHEEGVKEAQAERERAKREAETRMEVMKKELIQEVTELAALMASKALRRQITVENQRQLLDESIAELKANANRA
jgi:F-type H+-transporting ATPase subunit b